MHLLTSFMGAVVNLMTDTGPADILCWRTKRKNGEKVPHVHEGPSDCCWDDSSSCQRVHCYDDLMEVLEDMSAKRAWLPNQPRCLLWWVIPRHRSPGTHKWGWHQRCIILWTLTSTDCTLWRIRLAALKKNDFFLPKICIYFIIFILFFGTYHCTAPYILLPFFWFGIPGEMRNCKGKADLKNKEKVEKSRRHRTAMDCSVLDGWAIL